MSVACCSRLESNKIEDNDDEIDPFVTLTEDRKSTV